MFLVLRSCAACACSSTNSLLRLCFLVSQQTVFLLFLIRGVCRVTPTTTITLSKCRRSHRSATHLPKHHASTSPATEPARRNTARCAPCYRSLPHPTVLNRFYSATVQTRCMVTQHIDAACCMVATGSCSDAHGPLPRLQFRPFHVQSSNHHV